MRTLLALTLALCLGAIGFLAAGALAGDAARGTVSLRTTKLGPVLVDSKGRTLYLFTRDLAGRSACSKTCATRWPPVISRGTPTAGAGAKQPLLAKTKRSNGATQVTYNEHPLYRYALDKRPGQTLGQRLSAFGGRWYAISSAGKPVTAAPPSGTPTTTTTTTTTTTPYPTDPYP
jgi:predicted lipoprotein with Yx(FWY)xxD motif